MQRTGTTSLVKGLNMLGIKACHFPGELLYDLDHPIITKFQGFADNPIPLLYRQLDSRHPNSKFILTVRDEREWLKSVRWLFTEGREVFCWDSVKVRDLIRDIHTGLYGTTAFDETVFLEKYRAHHQEVIAYFADRTDTLSRQTDPPQAVSPPESGQESLVRLDRTILAYRALICGAAMMRPFYQRPLAFGSRQKPGAPAACPSQKPAIKRALLSPDPILA
jgi:hypothetical protein